jgi:hypothetical protein
LARREMLEALETVAQLGPNHHQRLLFRPHVPLPATSAFTRMRAHGYWTVKSRSRLTQAGENGRGGAHMSGGDAAFIF